MRSKTFFLWVSPLLLGSFLGGLLLMHALEGRKDRSYWNDAVVERVREIVGREYVDPVTEDQGKRLFFAAMEGYLRGLDPFCRFFDPEEWAKMQEATSGEFGGIGVLLRKAGNGGGFLVRGVRRGDPAERAGIRIGDRIVAVEGTSVAETSLRDLIRLLRGPPGSRVRVGLVREGRPWERELVRSEIRIDSVVGVRMVDREKGIGYLRVAMFHDGTGKEARRALTRLQKQGARSFILDLRQNGGGVLEKGAVALADLFFEDGVIVRTRGRTPGSRKVYLASREGTACPTEPLAVLVDGGSASASEVVAGAFQDRHRGILVGLRTYGKFIVQSIHRLPGLGVALQLTTARYFTPLDRWLQRRDDRGVRGGLVPDVVVPRTGENERDLERIFASQHGLDMEVGEEPEELPDPQLERAEEILREHAPPAREVGDPR